MYHYSEIRMAHQVGIPSPIPPYHYQVVINGKVLHWELYTRHGSQSFLIAGGAIADQLHTGIVFRPLLELSLVRNIDLR